MAGLLTFTSDFGTEDSYVAEVKGVLKALDSEIQVIDITHWVKPGNLTAASFVLLHAFRYFPTGTTHLAVIDPGVGSERDILAVRTETFLFIGPDNGVLHEAVTAAGGGTIFALDTERFLRTLQAVYPENEVAMRIVEQGPSSTFHGRDLFAPFSAYLLGGHPIREVARQKETMIKHEIMRPAVNADRLQGRIVYIDRFGNLISNIEARMVGQQDEIFLKSGESVTLVGKLKRSYASAGQGVPLAIAGSRGLLEIAVSGGSAKEHFKASYGDDVLVLKKPESGGEHLKRLRMP